MIDPSKPVRLRRAPEFIGKVHGAILNGRAYVRWDTGGAHSVHVDDLIQEGTDMTEETPDPAHDRRCERKHGNSYCFCRDRAAAERRAASADKSWPPKNLETKVPGVDRK